MGKFKEKIRSRVFWLLGVAVILGMSYLILLLKQDQLPEVSDFILGFHGGVLTGIEGLIFISIFKYVKAMKNEKILKELYISENDERTIMIMQKTGAIGMNICIIGFGFATVIAGFFNEIVFFTLLGATLFTALIKGFFKIYYHYKL